MRFGRFVVGALLTLALSSPGWGLQLSDLLRECRAHLNDATSDTNFQRFSNQDLIDFLNQGQDDINDNVWVLQSTYTLDLAAGTTEYILPADFLTSVRVVLNNNKLIQTTRDNLDANTRGWQIAVATPTGYFIDNWSSTSTYVGFYPAPKYSTYGGEANITYVQKATPMVNLTDYPFNGKAFLFQYHRALIHFCVAQGWDTINITSKSEVFRSLYANDIKLMLFNSQRMPDYNPSIHGLAQPGYGQ